MHLKIVSALLVVVFILLSETEAWWVFGGGSSSQCPSRGGASPYYFGTTNLFCMGKRGAPARGTWALSHRFIYYKGYYFEFLNNSKAYISLHRQAESRCSGSRESSPAGYSELSLECIKGCARNYKCHFGSYSLLGNNCHKFANRLSDREFGTDPKTATPYYFGTTDLSCMHRNMKGKRSAPSRGTLEWVHRFIYYKGYYFEFFDNSKAYISTQRQFANVCPGGPESSPAGYSELDIDCIKGCARNYRCHFGSYSLLMNNCHDFTNEISEVLCTRGQTCPAWCLDDCNHAVERN